MNKNTLALLRAADFELGEPPAGPDLILVGFAEWFEAKGASKTEIVLATRTLARQLERPDGRPIVSLVVSAQNFGLSLAFPAEPGRIYVPALDTWKAADPRPIEIATLDVERLVEVLRG